MLVFFSSSSAQSSGRADLANNTIWVKVNKVFLYIYNRETLADSGFSFRQKSLLLFFFNNVSLKAAFNRYIKKRGMKLVTSL